MPGKTAKYFPDEHDAKDKKIFNLSICVGISNRQIDFKEGLVTRPIQAYLSDSNAYFFLLMNPSQLYLLMVVGKSPSNGLKKSIPPSTSYPKSDNTYILTSACVYAMSEGFLA